MCVGWPEWIIYDQTHPVSTIQFVSRFFFVTSLNCWVGYVWLFCFFKIMKRNHEHNVQCFDCGYVCKTRQRSQIHARVHSGEKPYKYTNVISVILIFLDQVIWRCTNASTVAKTIQMLSVWFLFFTINYFDSAQTNTQRRKTIQMRPVWFLFFTVS